MDNVFMVLTCGWPCNFFNRVSLWLMGSWGHSCLSLMVKIVEWSLVLSSSESVLFVMAKNMDCLMMCLWVMRVLVVYVFSLGVVCIVPFSDTWCVRNLSKHNIAGRNGPEM